jgi:TonB-linked SusC/RagA family outer membrane protein
MRTKGVWIACVMAIMVSQGVGAQEGTSPATQMATQPPHREASPVLDRVVSIHLTRVTLDVAIGTIARAANIQLALSDDVLPSKQLVSIDVDGISAGEAFRRVLQGSGLEVALTPGGKIFLTKSAEPRVVAAPITGRVIDSATRAPIANAQLRIIETGASVVTRDDGTFAFQDIAAGTYHLRAQRLGYRPLMRAVVVGNPGQAVTVDFALVRVATTLDQVVTTAIGRTQRRIEVGNSIAVINADSVMQNTLVNTTSDLLTGRAPGVQVLGSSGQLGEGHRIRVRGTASIRENDDPILIIDGVRADATFSFSGTNSAGGVAGSDAISSTQLIARSVNSAVGSASGKLNGISTPRTNALDELDPESIESIEVLKGPAASALYGTDAARGVIVITTKKGHIGRPALHFSAVQGWNDLPRGFPDSYQAWGHTYAGNPVNCTYSQSQFSATNACIVDSVTHFNPFNNSELSPLQSGRQTKVDGQVSGGAGGVRYFASGDFLNGTGGLRLPPSDVQRWNTLTQGASMPDWIMHPNAQQSGSGTVNLTTDLGLWGNLASSTRGFHQFTRNAPVQVPSGVDDIDGGFLAASGSVVTGIGYQNAYNGWGTSVQTTPLGMFEQKHETTLDRVTSSLTHNVTVGKVLNVVSTVGVDFNNTTQDGLSRAIDEQTLFGCTANCGSSTTGTTDVRMYTADIHGMVTNGLTTWLTSRLSAGFQFVRRTYDLDFLSAQGLGVGSETVNGAQTVAAAQYSTETKTAGQYLDEQLAFNDRLFIDGAMRWDVGSSFGKGAPAVAYPKLSVSWVASREPSIHLPAIISNLRLRAATGRSGIQPQPTEALRLYSPVQVMVDGVQTSGAKLSQVGSNTLLPATATETEGGFDLGLWNDRMNVEFTTYRKVTRNDIVGVNLEPALTVNSALGGAGVQEQNIGTVENRGVELALTVTPVNYSAFAWDVTVNGAVNHNKLLRINPNAVLDGGVNGYVTPLIVGSPVGGVVSYPGMYVDINHDGIITPNEVSGGFAVVGNGTGNSNIDGGVLYGSVDPTRQLSLNNGIRLFDDRFMISTMFDYTGGGVRRPFVLTTSATTLATQIDPTTSPLAYQAALLDQSIAFPGWYLSTSTWTWREMSISYQLPNHLTRLLRSSRSSVVLEGRNLQQWTKFDYPTPQTRFWSVRLNLDF